MRAGRRGHQPLSLAVRRASGTQPPGMSARQRGARAQANAAAARAGTAPAASEAVVTSKIDKTGLYDLQQVKRVLDDQIIAHLEKRGYAESTLVSNVKIVAGVVAVVAAVYSHFNGQEFPANRSLIIACVAVYAACLSLISAVSWMYEGDAFYVARLSAAASLLADEGGGMAPAVWVQSTVGLKGTSTFTLTLRRTVRKNAALSVALVKPYEQYFCEDGEVAVAALHDDLDRVVDKLGRLGKADKSK